jgi:hypothetical protein
MDSRYERPLPLTWNSEYIYSAKILEILHILSVEQDYNIELTTADFDNFNFFGGRTFATASQLQELLFDKVIEHTLLRSTEDDRSRHNTNSRVYLINQYVKALRKCVPDVDVDLLRMRVMSCGSKIRLRCSRALGSDTNDYKI